MKYGILVKNNWQEIKLSTYSVDCNFIKFSHSGYVFELL